MPVSPATVREASFLPEKPSAPAEPADPPGLATEDRDGERGDARSSRTRRLLLVGACVAAFLIGFAVVTLLMSGSDTGANPRRSTTPTLPGPMDRGQQAPAPTLPARATVPALPPSVPVDSQPAPSSPAPSSPAPSSPAPASMPRAENPRGPAPTTSAPAPSTSPATTTPVTTAP